MKLPSVLNMQQKCYYFAGASSVRHCFSQEILYDFHVRVLCQVLLLKVSLPHYSLYGTIVAIILVSLSTSKKHLLVFAYNYSRKHLISCQCLTPVFLSRHLYDARVSVDYILRNLIFFVFGIELKGHIHMPNQSKNKEDKGARQQIRFFPHFHSFRFVSRYVRDIATQNKKAFSPFYHKKYFW